MADWAWPYCRKICWINRTTLAVAIAWAGLRLGYALGAAIAMAMVALFAGFALVRRFGGDTAAYTEWFDPVAFDAVEAIPEHEVLELEEKDQILVLDDPLVELPSDSRVVRCLPCRSRLLGS